MQEREELKSIGETNRLIKQTRTLGGSQAAAPSDSRQRATGFRPGAAGRLRRMLQGLERDVNVDLAGATGTRPAPTSPRPAPPSSLHIPHQPPSRARRRPSPPGPNFPSSGGRRATRAAAAAAAGAGRGARGRAMPAALGVEGCKGGRGRSPRAGPAARAPASAPPRPRAAPPGFPPVSTLTPRRPWSHKPARKEKGTDETQTALSSLPEGRTRHRGDHHRQLAGPLPGHRGRRRRATDTNNN